MRQNQLSRRWRISVCFKCISNDVQTTGKSLKYVIANRDAFSSHSRQFYGSEEKTDFYGHISRGIILDRPSIVNNTSVHRWLGCQPQKVDSRPYRPKRKSRPTFQANLGARAAWDANSTLDRTISIAGIVWDVSFRRRMSRRMNKKGSQITPPHRCKNDQAVIYYAFRKLKDLSMPQGVRRWTITDENYSFTVRKERRQ